MDNEARNEEDMIRKLIVAAAAIAMPLAVVGVTGVTAGAAAHPNTSITCSATATVTFATPGLSNAGSVTTAKTSTTNTNGLTFGDGCTGSAPANAITSKNTKCSKTTPGSPSSNPACEPHEYGYDSWSNFESGGASSLQKALKKLSFTVNGTAYASKTTSVSDTTCSDGANGTEVGFKLVGTISSPKSAKGDSATLVACLGATTGSGINSTSNFASDIGGPGTVTSAQIDPATSTLTIS